MTEDELNDLHKSYEVIGKFLARQSHAQHEAPVDPSFIRFMQTEIEVECATALNTRTDERITLNVIKKFCPSATFADITYEFLGDFENYCIRTGRSINTINKYFRHIKKFVYIGMDKDLIQKNPFRHYRIRNQASRRAHLSPEELRAFENLKLTGRDTRYQKVLDMFLFSCYTGLRFSDIKSLNIKELKTEYGQKWIEKDMQKTGESIRVPVSCLFSGKPLAILHEYLSPETGEIFNEMSNPHVNRCLKELANLAGVHKLVCFHVARHTFATLLLNKGISITTVQKLLGHKKIQTTQIYSKVIDTTMIKELTHHN